MPKFTATFEIDDEGGEQTYRDTCSFTAPDLNAVASVCDAWCHARLRDDRISSCEVSSITVHKP